MNFFKKSKADVEENLNKMNEDEIKETVFQMRKGDNVWPKSRESLSLFGSNRNSTEDTGWLKCADPFLTKSVFAGSVKSLFKKTDLLFKSTSTDSSTSSFVSSTPYESTKSLFSVTDISSYEGDATDGEVRSKNEDDIYGSEISYQSSNANNRSSIENSENDSAVVTSQVNSACFFSLANRECSLLGTKNEIDNSERSIEMNQKNVVKFLCDDVEIESSNESETSNSMICVDPQEVLNQFKSGDPGIHEKHINADTSTKALDTLKEVEQRLLEDSSNQLCIEINNIKSKSLFLNKDGTWEFEKKPDVSNLINESRVVFLPAKMPDETLFSTVKTVTDEIVEKISSVCTDDDRKTSPRLLSSRNGTNVDVNEMPIERQKEKNLCLQLKHIYKCTDVSSICTRNDEILSFIQSDTDYLSSVLCTQISDEFWNIRKLYCTFSQVIRITKIVMCKFSHCAIVVCKSNEDAERLLKDFQHHPDMLTMSLLSKCDIPFEFQLENTNKKAKTSNGKDTYVRSNSFSADSEAIEAKLRTGVFLDSHHRVEALEMRDELWRRSNVSKAACCTDFCPEKERYVRHRISPFENDMYIKQYTRASADQIVALHFDLRPPSVLLDTLKYLLTMIDQFPFQHDLYNFMSDRLHAIRKDLVQQGALNSLTAVVCLETCVRFHVYSALRFCEEPASVFDPVLNENNLRNSLSSLLLCYETLSKKGKASQNEPEFIAISLMLSFKKQSLSRIKYFRNCLLNEPLVKFALDVHRALNSSNFLNFWSLYASAQPSLACLMHRIINHVRLEALESFLNFGRDTSTEYMAAVLGCSSTELPKILQHYNVDITDQKLFMKAKLTLPPLTRCRRIENLFKTKPLSEMLSGMIVSAEEFRSKCVTTMNSFDEKGSFIGSLPAQANVTAAETSSKSVPSFTVAKLSKVLTKNDDSVENGVPVKPCFDMSLFSTNSKSNVFGFYSPPEKTDKKDSYSLPAFYNEVTSSKCVKGLFGKKSMISPKHSEKPSETDEHSLESKSKLTDNLANCLFSDLITEHVENVCKDLSLKCVLTFLSSRMCSSLMNEETDRQTLLECYFEYILFRVKKQCVEELISRAIEDHIRSYIYKNFLEDYFIRWKENAVTALVHKLIHVPSPFDLTSNLTSDRMIFSKSCLFIDDDEDETEEAEFGETSGDAQNFIHSLMLNNTFTKDLEKGVYECYIRIIDPRMPYNFEQFYAYGCDQVTVYFKFSLISNSSAAIKCDTSILPHVIISSLQIDQQFSCPFLQINPGEDLLLMSNYAIKRFCVRLPKEPYELTLSKLLEMVDVHFKSTADMEIMRSLTRALDSCLSEASNFKVISSSPEIFESQNSPYFRELLHSALYKVYIEKLPMSHIQFMHITFDRLKLWTFQTESELFREIQNELISLDPTLKGVFTPFPVKRRADNGELSSIIKRSKECQTEKSPNKKRQLKLFKPYTYVSGVEESLKNLYQSLEIVQLKCLDIDKILSDDAAM